MTADKAAVRWARHEIECLVGERPGGLQQQPGKLHALFAAAAKRASTVFISRSLMAPGKPGVPIRKKLRTHYCRARLHAEICGLRQNISMEQVPHDSCSYKPGSVDSNIAINLKPQLARPRDC